jgi:hypothetical protein
VLSHGTRHGATDIRTMLLLKPLVGLPEMAMT